LAQGGALPLGDPAAVDAGKVQGPPKTVEKRRNCYVDMASPPGGNGIFTPDGTTLYFLANGGPSAKPAKKSGESLKSKYTLYRVNLSTRKAEPILALDHRGDPSLVLYGNPLEGMSVLSFVGNGASCYEGAGSVISISLTKKGAKAVQGTGSFVMARAPLGFVLVDMKKLQVLQMDTQTFQTKSVRRVNPSERPLFYEPKTRRLIAFHSDLKVRGLVDYAGEDERRARRLAIKAGDRVLQNGDRFAAARLDTKANAIEINELPEWTGLEKPGTYRISLPPNYPVAASGLAVNFAKRAALVFGGSYLAKQQWGRLFVYDYTRPEPVAVLPTTGKQSVNFAAIDPTGALAVIELRDQDTRATFGLKVFNFATQKFDNVKLPSPPREAKDAKNGESGTKEGG
jgi:hypothetical protein